MACLAAWEGVVALAAALAVVCFLGVVAEGVERREDEGEEEDEEEEPLPFLEAVVALSYSSSSISPAGNHMHTQAHTGTHRQTRAHREGQ